MSCKISVYELLQLSIHEPVNGNEFVLVMKG